MSKPAKRIATWLALLLLANGLPASAQSDEPPRLAEVVVTATRSQENPADVPSTIDVVTGAEIDQRQQALVSDALRGLPGVDITEFGSPGHSAFASIRGAAPDQVLTLLDGVEVNTPTVGQFDFANLTTNGVDRIEVLRGAGGTLYGSQAIGGVINVLTEHGTGPPQLSVDAEVGRGVTQRETLGLNGAYGPIGLAGSLSYFACDGFLPENDDYRNLSTVWRIDADLLPTATLRGIVRYSTSRTGLANFNVSDGVLDPDARDRDDFFLVKGEWEHHAAEALSYRTAVAFVRNNERFVDDAVDEEGETEPVVIGHFPTELIQAEAQGDYRWRDFSMTTVGVEFKERSADVFQFEAKPESDKDAVLRPRSADDTQESTTDEFRANRSAVAVYLQEQLRFLDDRLRGIGGVRYDHIDHFGDQVTFSGSGSYHIRPLGTRLRLGYHEGFRAPTFEELFAPELGEPELEAEQSREINAGFTQELLAGRLRVESTYFHRWVDNLIEEVVDQLPGPVAGVPEGLRATNLDARFQGVEVIATGNPTSWLTLAANYTYLNVGESTGVLVNRPRHRGSFTASAERSGLFKLGDRAAATVRLLGVGSRFSPDPFSEPEPFLPERIDGYARTDLALTYTFGGRLAPLTLTASVQNLFNRDYEESIGFPAPPAWFLIGFRYQLQYPA